MKSTKIRPASLSLLTVVVAVLTQLALVVPAHAQSSPSRLDKIKSSKELRVCIWPDYYSITYRNPKTRQLSGIDIAISKDLGREMGVSIRYIDSNFAQLIDSLLQDRCDIAMHAVGITAARKEKLQFTQPYLRSDIYAVVARTNTAVKTWADLDQEGRVLAVAAGTVMEPVMQQRLKKAKILSVKAPATREQEVESGRADAFMTDFPYSRRIVDLTDWAKVIAPPSVFFETDYAYAVAPGEPSFLNYINAYLGAIKKDGRLGRFAEQNGLQSIAVLK
jgi:ABC-type amino acid transport substrate-binding protein